MSILPRSINDPATKFLPPLQNNHRSPLIVIDRVDVSRRLDAHARSCTASGYIAKLRNIYILSSIELERGLCAVHFEMNL